jgi:hypothetical protein
MFASGITEATASDIPENLEKSYLLTISSDYRNPINKNIKQKNPCKSVKSVCERSEPVSNKTSTAQFLSYVTA